MNRFVFFALLFYTTVNPNVSLANEHHNRCASWGDISRAAMSARQAGVPLQTMLKLFSDETAVSILRLAYESARHDADTDRQASINDFVESVVAQCLSSSKNE